jgi:hypothetical protein
VRGVDPLGGHRYVCGGDVAVFRGKEGESHWMVEIDWTVVFRWLTSVCL